MKKDKKQSKRKKKLRTLVLVLFLTIVMLGTSTYAWFTANKVVTINSIDVQVNAAGGIQISTDASNWKSVITNADIKRGYAYNTEDQDDTNDIIAVTQFPSAISDVSTNASPTATGRLNMYSSTIDNDATTGNYTITTTLETDQGTATGVAYEAGGKYVVFDIFLRLDSPQTVYLTPSSDVLNLDATDKGLKNSARVAFVNQGNTTSSSTVEAIAAMTGNASSDVILWEPNSDAHSSTVVNSVAPEYSVTLTEIEEEGVGTGLYDPVTYYGVNTAITPAKDLISLVNGTLTGIASYATEMTSSIIDITTTENNSEYKVFKANLPAGVTKYRVYLWIEGQDIDCENNATGSNISFNISLSTTNTAS